MALGIPVPKVPFTVLVFQQYVLRAVRIMNGYAAIWILFDPALARHSCSVAENNEDRMALLIGCVCFVTDCHRNLLSAVLQLPGQRN